MKTLKWVNINYYNDQESYVNFNFGYYYLKSYYKFRGKHYDKLNWTLPMVAPKYTNQQILQDIAVEKPDILCISLYLWNRNLSYALITEAKRLYPNLVIVIGGPEVDAHRNKQFFVDHPEVDYVVYGSGEEGFKYLMDALLVDEPIADDAVNIVTRDQLWMHRVFDDKEYKAISPVIDMQDEIRRDYHRLRDYVGTERLISVRIERARGCPYNCTFCDWNSGLHNKVKRKTSNWREEIDFFKSLGDGLRVAVVDANWGIYPEDLEITRYALDKLDHDFGVTNVAKLNKDRVFEIFEMQTQKAAERNRIMWLKVSLQDIHEAVLEAIDRPEIPWLKHKQMLQDFSAKHPHVKYECETIIGLPNQTPAMYREQLSQFQEANIHKVIAYFWEILPNSPAFQQEYKDRWNITSSNIITPLSVVNSIDRIKEMYANNEHDWMENYYVTGTNTADFADIVEMYMMARVYTHMKVLFPKLKKPTDVLYKQQHKIRRVSEEMAENVLKHGILGTYFQNQFHSLWHYSGNHDAIMEIIKN